jgi:spermidine synthase
MQKVRIQVLYIIVFIIGGFSMIFELSGIRLLGPFLGTSIIVWSGTIGIIMASLAGGYHLGGKLADRFSAEKLLLWTLLASGFFMLYTTLGSQKIIIAISHKIYDLQVKTLLSAILLFVPANIFLGGILPLSAKLILTDMTHSGASIGKLYASSTLGSILGTVTGGFWLIPFWGHFNILLWMIVSLYLLAIVWSMLTHKKYLAFAILFAIMSAGIMSFKNFEHKYIDLDTRYNRVIVRETKDKNGIPIRKLFVNNEGSSAMYFDNDSLAFEVLNYYDLALHFRPDLQHIMMIGGSGYAYPKYFLHHFPGRKIDVVEIDPGLTEVARKYFRLEDNPDLRIFHEDGRTFLNKEEHRYDAILMDAYKSILTVPFQLTTQEAIEKIYNNLNDKGIFLANIIAAFDKEKNYFLRAELRTISSVFEDVRLFAVQYPNAQGAERKYFQNLMLVAFKQKDTTPLTSNDPRIHKMLANIVREKFPLDLPVLTDDYAPVEYYTYRSLQE